MNIYIGLGGYGCNCIAETNIDEKDLRILIDSDEMVLNSVHVKNNNGSTFRILYKKLRSKFDDLNKRLNYVYSDTEGVNNELVKILSTIDRSQNGSINIKLFSTMCGDFGSKHILKTANYVSIYAREHFTNYKIIIVLIPDINIDSLNTVLNNNTCDFIKEYNTEAQLIDDKNTKLFVITSDSNASFFHQSHRFITDVLEILKNIHTEMYIGEKNYDKVALWEFESCFLLTLKNWLPKATKRYSYINNEPSVNDSEHTEETTLLQDNKDNNYIFISYSHMDYERVFPIIEKLQNEGFNVWYDDGIDPGTEWDENIASHVEACGYFFAMISNNYLNSDNCKDELNYARDLNKNRLLIYLEECTLPGGMAMRLNRLQSIFEYKYPSKDTFYEKLFTAKGIESCKSLTIINDTFFDLLNINSINELNITDLRKQNNIISSLTIPIGKYTNGKIAALDLKENSNGLIIGNDRYEINNVVDTCLLSLASFYAPNDIQIQMIDFENPHRKLQELSHFTNVLTDNDEKSVKEFVSLITSETNKRKELYKQNDVSGIYQYNRLQKTEKSAKSLPHIVIIIKDIRILKVEQPEHFQRMIDLSKDANIFGIHWIFCTDNFFGLVDDKLYNASSFKLFSDHNESPAEQIFNKIKKEKLDFYLQTQSMETPKALTVAMSNVFADNRHNNSDANVLPLSISNYKFQYELLMDEIVKYDMSKC